jgi:hypothetical protein
LEHGRADTLLLFYQNETDSLMAVNLEAYGFYLNADSNFIAAIRFDKNNFTNILPYECANSPVRAGVGCFPYNERIQSNCWQLNFSRIERHYFNFLNQIK